MEFVAYRGPAGNLHWLSKGCKCPVQANWTVRTWYVVNSKSAFTTKVCPCSNVNSAQKSSRFKDLTLSEVQRCESCPGTIYLRPPSLKFTDKDPLNLGNLHFSVYQVGSHSLSCTIVVNQPMKAAALSIPLACLWMTWLN